MAGKAILPSVVRCDVNEVEIFKVPEEFKPRNGITTLGLCQWALLLLRVIITGGAFGFLNNKGLTSMLMME